MAICVRYDELKKEIDALVAENEELKQLVQLLRENQELKSILSNQYNENTFLPALNSPANYGVGSRGCSRQPQSGACATVGSPPEGGMDCEIPGSPIGIMRGNTSPTGGTFLDSLSPPPFFSPPPSACFAPPMSPRAWLNTSIPPDPYPDISFGTPCECLQGGSPASPETRFPFPPRMSTAFSPGRFSGYPTTGTTPTNFALQQPPLGWKAYTTPYLLQMDPYSPISVGEYTFPWAPASCPAAPASPETRFPFPPCISATGSPGRVSGYPTTGPTPTNLVLQQPPLGTRVRALPPPVAASSPVGSPVSVTPSSAALSLSPICPEGALGGISTPARIVLPKFNLPKFVLPQPPAFTRARALPIPALLAGRTTTSTTPCSAVPESHIEVMRGPTSPTGGTFLDSLSPPPFFSPPPSAHFEPPMSPGAWLNDSIPPDPYPDISLTSAPGAWLNDSIPPDPYPDISLTSAPGAWLNDSIPPDPYPDISFGLSPEYMYPGGPLIPRFPVRSPLPSPGPTPESATADFPHFQYPSDLSAASSPGTFCGYPSTGTTPTNFVLQPPPLGNAGVRRERLSGFTSAPMAASTPVLLQDSPVLLPSPVNRPRPTPPAGTWPDMEVSDLRWLDSDYVPSSPSWYLDSKYLRAHSPPPSPPVSPSQEIFRHCIFQYPPFRNSFIRPENFCGFPVTGLTPTSPYPLRTPPRGWNYRDPVSPPPRNQFDVTWPEISSIEVETPPSGLAEVCLGPWRWKVRPRPCPTPTTNQSPTAAPSNGAEKGQSCQ